MEVKLEIHIRTPYGIARKIRINEDSEIVFISIGPDKKEHEFSLQDCRILVSDEL